jgi:hypothetical protein
VFTASRLSQHIKNEAVQIDCAPKPMFLTVDRDDNFVEISPSSSSSRSLALNYDEAILPRAARCYVSGFRRDSGNPFHGLCDELRAIIGTNVLRDAIKIKTESTSMTSMDFSFRSIRMARRSCVNSSMMFSILYFLASWVRSSTKS